MKKPKIAKVTLKGSKTSGYVLVVEGKDGFVADMALDYEELVLIKERLKTLK